MPPGGGSRKEGESSAGERPVSKSRDDVKQESG